MKKQLLTFLLVALALLVMQPPAQAAEQKSYRDVTYKIVTLKNGAREVHITGAVDIKNHIVIPAKIEGLPVTEIGDQAFLFDRSDYASDGTYNPSEMPGYSDLFIQSVQLPTTLKRIGKEAFLSHHLRKVTLPNGLKEIGYGAFADNHLTAITIPKSVEKIGGNIVQGNLIKTTNIPTQFKQPKEKQSGKLLYVTFTRNGKTEVRITGHTYKTEQTKILIPKTINKMPVTEIGDYAFTHAASLLGLHTNKPRIKEVVLPETIRKIGNHALAEVRYDNNSRRAFSLPRDLEVIGDYAFAHNGITNRGNHFKFPQKLRSIGEGAFQWNHFQAITLPINIKTIEDYAFEYNQLKQVTMGNGIKTIAKGAFRGNNIASLTLPKDVVSIEDEAFYSNKLPRIVLPTTVTTVGEFAFARNQLVEAKLPNPLRMIGDGAFADNKLRAFQVPSNVTELPLNALLENPLQTIKIQGAVTKLTDHSIIYKSYRSTYYEVNRQLKLYTDAQYTQPWTNWGKIIPQRTTLYMKAQ
ncbi:MAG: leucine-rich repeat domain-containing protein [Solibacillus sp.]